MEAENKYQRGKIYKLISNQTEDVYYGSTIEKTITNRLSRHRMDYKYWLTGKHHYLTSYEIVTYDDCKIILVENFPCNTKYELTAREQYYIDNNKCINKQKANTGLSREEYTKQYNQVNKDKINEKNRQYHLDHKDEDSERHRRYNQEHKQQRREKGIQYYQDHKDEIRARRSIKYICECGGSYISTHKTRHMQTKKHQAWLNEQNEQ